MADRSPTPLRGLRGRRVVCADAAQLVERLTAALREAADASVRARGAFHLALSGGSTPVPLYRRLAAEAGFPWQATHLWLVDDRCVAPDDERSNARLIRELIAERVPLPGSHLHPMPVLEPDGEQRYEAALHAALAAAAQDRLDLVLLGMGTDGHTASLFPHSAALAERRSWVVFNDGPTVAPPRPRMTMTYPLLNAARTIAILVTGSTKHARLADVSRNPAARERLPVSGIAPSHRDAELAWYLDRAAATGREASGA
jgi:6-phosphogluconolactonase